MARRANSARRIFEALACQSLFSFGYLKLVPRMVSILAHHRGKSGSGNTLVQAISNTDKIKATDNAVFTFTQGSHILLSHQFNQTVARYAAANKPSHQKTTRWASPKCFVFSVAWGRYVSKEGFGET
jgi:hypothetical protein